jgi:WD40 repeat protein
MLASGSQDRTVKIWDLTTSSLYVSIPVHYPALACVESSGYLYVGLTAGSIALDLNTGSTDLMQFRELGAAGD